MHSGQLPRTQVWDAEWITFVFCLLYDSLWLNATLYTAKSLYFWHWDMIYSIHRAGDMVIDEEIKSFTKLERAFWMGIFILFLPRCRNVNSWKILWCWQKNHYENGLPSQMISHYLAIVLLLLHQFFSLFHVILQLRGNWEHTVYNFKKELNRINISPWKWKLCVNIYTIEFKSIHWMRPMEGCFLYTESQQNRRKIQSQHSNK